MVFIFKLVDVANVTFGKNTKIWQFIVILNGAGAVVAKDVAPFTLMFGNPAKFIRTLDAKKSN